MTIGAAIKLRKAILLAFDTRTHKRQDVLKVLNAQGIPVVVKNKKAYLAQYCALLAAGNRAFNHQIYQKLLEEVTKQLNATEGPQQILVDDLVLLLKKSISDEVKRAGKKKSNLILATWEQDNDGEYTPILRKFRKRKYIPNEGHEFCAIGHNWVFAELVIQKEYDIDMSIADGINLLVRALKDAASKDHADILGGDIEVLVLGPRNYLQLPLPRREQTLDRAITFFNKGPIKTTAAAAN